MSHLARLCLLVMFQSIDVIGESALDRILKHKMCFLLIWYEYVWSGVEGYLVIILGRKMHPKYFSQKLFNFLKSITNASQSFGNTSLECLKKCFGPLKSLSTKSKKVPNGRMLLYFYLLLNVCSNP